MFKITKFVIAAALTAIIAAPVMAQVECPCWGDSELDTDDFAKGDYICFENEGNYALLLGEDPETKELEQAQVSQNLMGEAQCFYQPSRDQESHKLNNVNSNQFTECYNIIITECSMRAVF